MRDSSSRYIKISRYLGDPNVLQSRPRGMDGVACGGSTTGVFLQGVAHD